MNSKSALVLLVGALTLGGCHNRDSKTNIKAKITNVRFESYLHMDDGTIGNTGSGYITAQRDTVDGFTCNYKFDFTYINGKRFNSRFNIGDSISFPNYFVSRTVDTSGYKIKYRDINYYMHCWSVVYNDGNLKQIMKLKDIDVIYKAPSLDVK